MVGCQVISGHSQSAIYNRQSAIRNQKSKIGGLVMSHKLTPHLVRKVVPLLSALSLLTLAPPAHAITTSGQITGAETWSGTVTLTGDVTVTATRVILTTAE
jgi:hypothetical protein